MKKLLAALVLTTIPTLGVAHGNRHNYTPHHRHGSHVWIAPLIIGGAVGAAIASQRPPVVTYSPQQYLPPPPYGYTYINVYDHGCNCYRWVLTNY
jgi:hypothetical protein